ncbi:MAG TPA: hypothetical protein VK335_02215 [Bryobacteraceae bacterium]|nr:hypothetical protein [Bryobacteraceae bacterium]
MATAVLGSAALDTLGARSVARPSRGAEMASVMAVAIFLLYTSWRAVYVHFSSDEMMNIYWYWEPGAWKALCADVLFWRKIVRPMGGLYYLPLFHWFGFNPWPYTVARLVILLFVSMLLLRLAARLTGSLTAATIAVMVVAYHPELVSLTHSGSYIYDILCAGFYFAAFLYYLSRRDSNGRLSLIQSCAFLALYLGALDSKEMAVSLPVMVCAYELLEATRSTRKIAVVAKRFLPHAPPVAAAVVITALFIAFKTYGPDGLAQIDSYHPVFTWARFADSSQRFLNATFCTTLFRAWSVLAVWVLLLYVGIRKRNRRLLLLLVWVVAAPLPLNFIPPHGPGCIYILLAGWSMIVAMAFEGLARRTAHEPLFAWLPEGAAVVSLLAAALFYYTSVTTFRHERIARNYFREGEKTWNLIQQFHDFPFRPPHGSRIAFVNDPFPEGWDTLFIAKLWWRDRRLQVSLQNRQHLPASALAQMDYVFDFPQGRLTRMR